MKATSILGVGDAKFLMVPLIIVMLGLHVHGQSKEQQQRNFAAADNERKAEGTRWCARQPRPRPRAELTRGGELARAEQNCCVVTSFWAPCGVSLAQRMSLGRVRVAEGGGPMGAASDV